MYIFPRSDMVSEREQTAELQAKLSCSVQEKLTAERERGRLELEIQRLKEQLKWHQEQLSSTKEALISSQTPEQHTDHVDSRISPGVRSKDECLDQVTGLHGFHWLGSFDLYRGPYVKSSCMTVTCSEIGLTGWSRMP